MKTTTQPQTPPSQPIPHIASPAAPTETSRYASNPQYIPHPALHTHVQASRWAHLHLSARPLGHEKLTRSVTTAAAGLCSLPTSGQTCSPTTPHKAQVWVLGSPPTLPSHTQEAQPPPPASLQPLLLLQLQPPLRRPTASPATARLSPHPPCRDAHPTSHGHTPSPATPKPQRGLHLCIRRWPLPRVRMLSDACRSGDGSGRGGQLPPLRPTLPHAPRHGTATQTASPLSR